MTAETKPVVHPNPNANTKHNQGFANELSLAHSARRWARSNGVPRLVKLWPLTSQKLSMARSGATHPPKPLNMNGHTRYRLSRDMCQQDKLYKQISQRKMVSRNPHKHRIVRKVGLRDLVLVFCLARLLTEVVSRHVGATSYTRRRFAQKLQTGL